MRITRPDVRRPAAVWLRAFLCGWAGFCILTLGGISVLQLPGAVNIWLVFAVLAAAGVCLAECSRDVQTLLSSHN